eukprot:g977.t1
MDLFKSRYTKAEIRKFIDTKLKTKKSGNDGNCSHRVAALCHWLNTGDGNILLPENTLNQHILFRHEIDSSKGKEADTVGLSINNCGRDLPENKLLWKLTHVETNYIDGGDITEGVKVEYDALKKEAVQYKSVKELADNIVGDNGFVVLPATMGNTIGHVLAWARLPKDKPITKCGECQEKGLCIFWTEEKDYECDVCKQKFEVDTKLYTCLNGCDWDICMSCKEKHVVLIDTYGNGESCFLHENDDLKRYKDQDLQIAPFFGFANEVRKKSYLQTELNEQNTMKKENIPFVDRLAGLPEGELVGIHYEDKEGTWKVKRFNGDKRFIVLHTITGREKISLHNNILNGNPYIPQDARISNITTKKRKREEWK